MALTYTYGNLGRKDKRKLKRAEDCFDSDLESDCIRNKCYCDGKHVCVHCQRKEKAYYEE